MSTAERLDLGTVYAGARERVGALVTGRADIATTPVPACPAWTVHDVVAHLVAVVEDVMAGKLTGVPTEVDTAAQVARRAGRPMKEMVDEWDEMAPPFEALLSSTPVWPAAMDVLSHEQDIRAATGQPGARDEPAIIIGARRLVLGIPSPVDLVVHLDSEDLQVGPGTGDAHPLELTTTSFEAFRFRLGRRSRAQLAGLAWIGDPAPVLDHLTIFGPNPADIIE
jgi:uncharacterized protein (TIGR03083 family)